MAERPVRRGLERQGGRDRRQAGRLARERIVARRDIHKDPGVGPVVVRMSAARVTVIDQARGIGPRAFDRQGLGARDPLAAARLARLEVAAEGRDPKGILRLALREEFEGQTAVVSSFGSESAVLLHMVAAIDPTTPVLFLNTGKLFGETLRYRDRLQDELGLSDVRSLAPTREARETLDPDGALWS